MRRTLESNISTPRRRDGLDRHLGRTAYFTAQSSAPQLRLRCICDCAAFATAPQTCDCAASALHSGTTERERERAGPGPVRAIRSRVPGRGGPLSSGRRLATGVRIGGAVLPFRLLGGGPGAGQLLTRTGGPAPRRQRLGARAGRRWCPLRVYRPGVPGRQK